MTRFYSFATVSILLATLLVACDGPSPDLHGKLFAVPIVTIVSGVDTDGDDSPLKLVGERFFRESRFSQYFFKNSQGLLNQVPGVGDPVVENLQTLSSISPNPYRGTAISCAACHFVEQAGDIEGAGTRAYTDFLRRSFIPDRGDGLKTTPRNSPNMVSMSLQDGMFLHNDGEYVTPEDLTRAGFLGRNMGWLIGEEQTAIHHIAKIVLEDDGSFPTETDLGGLSYRQILTGASLVPGRFQVPAEFKFDPALLTDEQIFDGVVKLVGAYLRTLNYKHNAQGENIGTPYDKFLAKNNLPRVLQNGETAIQYSQRLIDLINNATSLQFVSNADGRLALHDQDFSFKAKELEGMRIFFGRGQCIECHAAPDFTDRLFHNTGASQDNYEQVHGMGTFAALNIPKLADRNQNANLYLPASPDHPQALSLMRSVPDTSDKRKADLGAWVVFGNPAMPKPQALLRTAICKSVGLDCDTQSDEQVLAASVGLVKTPSVRDLGQSQPYLHTGQADGIEDVLTFYIRYANMARMGKVVNADPKLKDVAITPADFDALTAFLKSLNEDYQ